jgi:hypothetical protein
MGNRMALPADGPASLAGVKTELGIDDTRSDDRLTAKVEAVNALVADFPKVKAADGAADWSAHRAVVNGANMLVARLWQRRNSPLGFEAIGDQAAVYVSRNDPDLAMMLGLGPWQDPRNLVG